MALLRYFGLPISPDELITAQKTFQYVGAENKTRLCDGLRAVIVKKRVDISIFNQAFEIFFNPYYKPQYSNSDKETYNRSEQRFLERLENTYREIDQEIGRSLLENKPEHAIQQLRGYMNQNAGFGGAGLMGELIDIQNNLQRSFRLSFGIPVPIHGLTPAQREELSPLTVQVASNLHFFEDFVREIVKNDTGLSQYLNIEDPDTRSELMSATLDFLNKDMNFLSLQVSNVKEQLIEVGKILASRERRRRQRAKSGKIDFRRTFRKNLSNNGVPVNLVKKRRRIQDPELIVLNDVSGSTRWVSSWFFVITYASQSVYRKIRVFEFDNTMIEVTDALKKQTIDSALEERYKIWERPLRKKRIHSDYHTSLEDFFFLTQYKPINRRTTVIILGDCRDYEGSWYTDRPASAKLLERITKKVKRLIILNPEEESRWDTGDSVVDYYRQVGAEIYHVSTLTELIKFVFELRRN